MDMVGLQTLLAVKNVLNFTVAARELGFAQSTVSAQIKQLEEELGYPLFERSGKLIFLSSGGVQFAPIASDTLYLYSKAKTLTGNAMEITGDLRMGILESLLPTFTETIVPQFRSRYKNVNLRIIVNNTNAICQVVQQSDSIAYLPAYSVKQRVEEGALRILHTNIPTQEYYIKVVSRKNKWIDPYTEDLIETIKRTF